MDDLDKFFKAFEKVIWERWSRDLPPPPKLDKTSEEIDRLYQKVTETEEQRNKRLYPHIYK